MSFDWQQYLSLAEYMNAHVDDFPDAEAGYRSVISRVYYMARNYTEIFTRLCKITSRKILIIKYETE